MLTRKGCEIFTGNTTQDNEPDKLTQVDFKVIMNYLKVFLTVIAGASAPACRDGF